MTIDSIRVDARAGTDSSTLFVAGRQPLHSILATSDMSPVMSSLTATDQSRLMKPFPTLVADDEKRSRSTDVIVELKNVHKTYLLGIEGVPALRGVSLQVKRGELVVIYGTSGGGKSSLLNIVGTIDKPTKGELLIGDTVINPKTKEKTLANIRLSTLGFVFQSFNLISSMTALENVELPMTLKGEFGASERRRRAIASLERVGLGHRLTHFPAQLSGGEQQRVTIARAIANNPQLLLLDEPTGDLDSVNTHRIIDLLLELNREKNMTMLMVTHDMYLKNFADRVVWMRDGKIAKIEEIPADKRQHAFEDLRQKIVTDNAPKRSISSQEITNAVDSTTLRFTKVRQPADYEVVTFSSKNAHSPRKALNVAHSINSNASSEATSIPHQVRNNSVERMTPIREPSASHLASSSHDSSPTHPSTQKSLSSESRTPSPEHVSTSTWHPGHGKSKSFTAPGYRAAAPVRQEMLVPMERRDENVFYESNDVVDPPPDVHSQEHSRSNSHVHQE